MTNTVKTEELPSPTDNTEPISPKPEEIKSDVPPEPKRHSSSRCSSHYSHRSHPVPKPLTLQGEKIVDADYPQTSSRVAVSTLISCQRRGSLKGQPLITELFEDSNIEMENPIVKPEPTPPTKPSTIKMKKQKPCFIKNAKLKKIMVNNKPKISITLTAKTEMKSQSTSTDMNEEEDSNEKMIIVGGTDWMMSVKPQVTNKNNGSVLSQLDEIFTVDDEDLPYCTSPIDPLAASQPLLMTSVGDIAVRISFKRILNFLFFFYRDGIVLNPIKLLKSVQY